MSTTGPLSPLEKQAKENKKEAGGGQKYFFRM